MKHSLLFILLISVLATACNSDSASSLPSIIPLPKNITLTSKAEFTFSEQTQIVLSDYQDEKIQHIANELIVFVAQEILIQLELVTTNGGADNAETIIKLSLDEQIDNSEQYRLSVDNREIKLSAGSYQGLFYGVQSLKQLLLKRSENNAIQSIVIDDQPRFGYRGMLLDVSRHFFTVEEVKQVLDLMAFYKLNTFHWHLTDDQGWRIEINQYPLLTSIGSYRTETMLDKNADPFLGDGIAHFGFYSQEDIREVVQYAKDRYITIIPEIDMPGHMQAALAAYPEFACTDGPFNVSTRWGVHKDILCPSEETFVFLENVLTEIIELFPSDYIHIGGDEVPNDRWKNSAVAKAQIDINNLQNENELQGYFYQRMADFLKSHNRKTMGWDEIQDKGLQEPTTIMAWQNLDRAEMAIKNGHETIMALREYTYFNYYQSNHDGEPLAQCCLITLEQAYNFDPMPKGLSPEEESLVLGAQANMWTEYIKDFEHLEYMLMPRMLAFSETVWTNKEQINWSSFINRVHIHTTLLTKWGINYREIDK